MPLRVRRGGWTLDLERLLAALTPGTRAVLINSPNNPTGWTLDARAQQAILAHCRRHGIWIVADDVYERLYYAGDARRVAPSFLDLADAGRSRRQHQQLLQVVADDRLAAGLDRRAAAR